MKEKHNEQWFVDRVGKRVYRLNNNCDCCVCVAVFEHGLIISDKFHANYLFDCQNELELFYSDTPLTKTEVTI